MYKKLFIGKAIQKISVVFIFLSIIFYLTYKNTDSVVISLFVVFGCICIWLSIFGGGLKRRRVFVESLLSYGFSLTEEYPISNERENPGVWVKGVGYTDGINQPMWTRVDASGIVLFYMCFARKKKPFLIPWDRVSQISLRQGFMLGESGLLARLFIPGIGMKIGIPWDERFNKLVPDKVSLQI